MTLTCGGGRRGTATLWRRPRVSVLYTRFNSIVNKMFTFIYSLMGETFFLGQTFFLFLWLSVCSVVCMTFSFVLFFSSTVNVVFVYKIIISQTFYLSVYLFGLFSYYFYLSVWLSVLLSRYFPICELLCTYGQFVLGYVDVNSCLVLVRMSRFPLFFLFFAGNKRKRKILIYCFRFRFFPFIFTYTRIKQK